MTTKVTGLFTNSEETQTVAAGETVFAAGDQGEAMYGIVRGTIELRVGDQVVATLGPDDVFGEMAVVDSSPRSTSAVAAEETELAVISRRRFLFLVHETPMFALHVMSALADKLRASNEVTPQA